MGSLLREPKCCTICRTTETPLWRGGPSGPKVPPFLLFSLFLPQLPFCLGSLGQSCSILAFCVGQSLCNACGIRYGKKRRELQGVEGGCREKVAKRGKSGKSSVAGVLRLLGPGKDALVKLKRRRPWRRMAEVEEAAVLLMALSCGFLYA